MSPPLEISVANRDLSSAMRELLPLKRLVRTVARIVTGDENVKIVTKSDVFEDNNGVDCGNSPQDHPTEQVLCSEAPLLQRACED